MRRALLCLAALGLTASGFGYQAKADSAYWWGQSSLSKKVYNSQINMWDYWKSDEIFLLEVDLNDGSFKEVGGSRVFAKRTQKYEGSNWKHTYTNPAGIQGTPTFENVNQVGDKIYFQAGEYDGNNWTYKWSYFDLSTNTYGLALKDGSLDGTQQTNEPENFFPDGAIPDGSSFANYAIPLNAGTSSGTGGGAAVDLTPVHKRIDDNKSAIWKNKKAIETNRTNINNLGDGIAASTALGAALSALPVTPDDAPFSCGVGSGAYSSRFAMGLGCVAKLNQRLSLNAGGSHVFGGSSNYGGGSLDSVAWRGGFVLKLGKLDSPALNNEQLQSKVKELEERNAAVDAKYSAIQAENAEIKQANKALMARLERLEAIALGQQPATTTASLK